MFGVNSSVSVPCKWTPASFHRPTRSCTVLRCNEHSTAILLEEINSDVTPTVTSMDDAFCLTRVIKQHCKSNSTRVPRVVHYVRFGDFNLTIDAFYSVLSVVRFVQPCLILLHSDALPTGPHWHALLHLVPNIMHVQKDRPRQIYGNVINMVEHSSDVARLQIMFGGYTFAKPGLFAFRLGFVHPLQDVAIHQCLPLSSVSCFPDPGGSHLPCYVVLPSSAWSSS